AAHRHPRVERAIRGSIRDPRARAHRCAVVTGNRRPVGGARADRRMAGIAAHRRRRIDLSARRRPASAAVMIGFGQTPRMRRLFSVLLTVLAIAIAAPLAAQQQPPPTPPPAQPTPPSAPTAPGSETVNADRREYTNEQKNAHYIGHVEIERSDGKIYADDVV